MKIIVRNRAGAKILPDGLLLSDSVRSHHPSSAECFCAYNCIFCVYVGYCEGSEGHVSYVEAKVLSFSTEVDICLPLNVNHNTITKG